MHTDTEIMWSWLLYNKQQNFKASYVFLVQKQASKQKQKR